MDKVSMTPKNIPFNTNFSKEDFENAINVGAGWFSKDKKYFYKTNLNQIFNDNIIKLPIKFNLDIEETLVICDRAFSGVKYYSEVLLPKNLIALGQNIFSDVDRIEYILFPEKLQYIKGNPFEGVFVKELNNISPYFNSCGKALFTKKKEKLISLYSECSVFKIKYPTRVIGERAVAKHTSIKEVSMDESILKIEKGAFAECPLLKSVILPSSLEIIEDEAFYHTNIHPYGNINYQKERKDYIEYDILDKIVITQNVKSIGRKALVGIKSIENLSPHFIVKKDALYTSDMKNLITYWGKGEDFDVPKGVKTIYAYAFFCNEHLKRIILPSSVEIVEEYAFAQCSELCQVVFKGSKTEIKKGAFCECTSLRETTLPDKLDILEPDTFYNCSSLESISLPHSIKSIGEDSFSGCNKLKNITFHEGLEIINANSFRDCTSLSIITLPLSLKSIECFAFSSCYLNECVILSKNTKISIDAFKNGNDDMLLIIPEDASIKDYINVIPEGTQGYTEYRDLGPIPQIGPKYENIVPKIDNKNIEELLESPEFYNISTYLYYDNNGGVYTDGMQRLVGFEKGKISNKKKYVVSKRTKFITHKAFHDLPFEEIILPDSLIAIGDYAFQNCYFLKSMTFPKNVKYIGLNPFYKTGNCLPIDSLTTHLSRIVSESTSYIIDSNCLLTSDRLNVISCVQCIPNLEQSYASYSNDIDGEKINYNNRNKLEAYSCSIPDGVKCIQKHAFAGARIKDITLPSSVEIIQEGAFEYCDFDYIQIPDSVKIIEASSFRYCNKLQSIDMSSCSITSLRESVFEGCDSLENTFTPNCLTSIGDHTFKGCKNLKSFYLSHNIEEIGVNPFVGTGLTEINCCNSKYFVKDGILFGNEGKEVIAVIEKTKDNITLHNGVEFINQEAFAENKTIKEVRCPASLKSIGDKAFYNCSSLQKIIIDESSITELPYSVFCGCKKLVSVTLPLSLSKICKYAFSNCEMLEDITLPRYVRKIEYDAFDKKYLKCLKTFYTFDSKILPSDIKHKAKQLSLDDCGLCIDKYGVIYNNDKRVLIKAPWNLENYVVPNGVEEIADEAFFENSCLKKITFPNTLKKIGNNVFFECRSGIFSLPDSVIEIGDNLFSYHVEEFKIPSSVSKINGNPFGQIINPQIKSSNYCHISNESDAFSLINGLLYSKDLKHLICCTDVKKKSIEILDTVIEINNRAFCCSRATKIMIPKSVQKIGSRSFCYSSVSNFVIPGTIKIIEEESFYSCHATEIVLSEGIKEIKPNAFSGCNNIKELVLPFSLEKVGRSAFSSCHNLQTIYISNPHTEIDSESFIYCDKIKRIFIPRGSMVWYKKSLTNDTHRLREDDIN